jgi:hypothetical protein
MPHGTRNAGQAMSTNQDVERLAEHFLGAPMVAFDTSPLYRALCPVVAEDRLLLELLTLRRPGQQASFLLFGAVHQLLLDGADDPLREYYASIVTEPTRDQAEAGPLFLEFCRKHRAPLEQLIRTRLVQSNVVRRTVGLRYALWAIGQRSAEPVHLIEIGASAGLLMNVDRYGYVIGDRQFGEPDAPVVLTSEWRGDGPVPDLDAVPRIASRIGVDLNPIDLADERERLWLRALVWPEQRATAAQLEAAIELARVHPPTLVAGDAVDVCRALGRDLPAGEVRMVFHAATRMHVPEERRDAFDAAIDSLGEGGPLFHVWLEPSNAPHAGYPVEERGVIAMHGPTDDAATALVRVDGHLHWLEPVG